MKAIIIIIKRQQFYVSQELKASKETGIRINMEQAVTTNKQVAAKFKNDSDAHEFAMNYIEPVTMAWSVVTL